MIENNQKQPTMDDYSPKTRLQFPDGAILTVGTRRDVDDPMYYGVNLVYASGATPEPEMNILLPPHSIDVLIPILENFANQARYIMGDKTVEYPPLPKSKKPRKAKSAPAAAKEEKSAKADLV